MSKAELARRIAELEGELAFRDSERDHFQARLDEAHERVRDAERALHVALGLPSTFNIEWGNDA